MNFSRALRRKLFTTEILIGSAQGRQRSRRLVEFDSLGASRVNFHGARESDSGQVAILLVLMLSLFLLAVLAFAVDYTNIWFQRQQV